MTTTQFVHAGANLTEADKTELKKLNEEIASLSNAFSTSCWPPPRRALRDRRTKRRWRA